MVKRNICMYTKLSIEECMLNIKHVTCEDRIGNIVFASDDILFAGNINSEKLKIRKKEMTDNFPLVVFRGQFKRENEMTKVEGSLTNQLFPNMPLFFKILLTIIGLLMWYFAIKSGVGLLDILIMCCGILMVLSDCIFINKNDANYIIENLKRILEIDNDIEK